MGKRTAGFGVIWVMELGDGIGGVLFNTKDCPKCRDVPDGLGVTKIGNLAVVEIPPVSLDPPLDHRIGKRPVWLRLSPAYRWLIEPATKFKMVDGVVKSTE